VVQIVPTVDANVYYGDVQLVVQGSGIQISEMTFFATFV
jgi:hypothetical protein